VSRPRRRPTARASFAASFSRLLVSHSHITKTSTPSSRRARVLRRSLDTFARNLASQNTRFRFGVVVLVQPRCLCQKQPCTNMARSPSAVTRSGLPGSDFTLCRTETPRLRRTRPTVNSPPVSFCRTARISADRAGSVFGARPRMFEALGLVALSLRVAAAITPRRPCARRPRRLRVPLRHSLRVPPDTRRPGRQ